ncbi:MAG: CRISPR-associated endonuclease Cas2 [Candidatus Taylorbacteria bacterium RIFCSPLOWO2_02_FULL_43_11]|uniref:CRISPR-associated endoribonuclease Cas2 n=1 Tax=Candidatus Taylorbacteria bacterium RIFCSPHIGHO2_02_FULL_43_32b TaxID=1802306 RepID=A0A1G2MFV8_9BACT|nr:MAG: CRISPR-associated endonuclease Cas2 [Candidatus Taylorbacteria bacterium RIFCSPHIGHO2_01_FULL_43_47]OHA22805.1 MAG: CRISPR-associated endonuclease Cas2 [Candidatus Taylorbacteria bacterium RIFCSPHIGHO2_02_FULL_43_32b]OHA30860.1 MAG: CRISPR-associated endonuclease Cas2 [Candidatus Taylorbacteria bacterium RIFCSPLOWO2_01_FULL_43_44]OHA35256.1 MAG: CRISPR-associated endonuclease Cas2 [Candidatus Taylorbacteria bacterium RIFCSPLOWO2_02_FULL_43_11]
MGQLETESKIRTRNSKIKSAILTTLAVSIAGSLNAGALVRGVLQELKKPKEKRVLAQNAIYNARKRLSQLGLISYENGLWYITEEGRKVLSTSVFGQFERPKKWDKKWRILIFDIGEDRRTLREKVRRTLVSVGFRRLQDSVWAYPYDREDLIALIKTDFKIGKDMLYIIADQIENDIELRREFGLM